MTNGEVRAIEYTAGKIYVGGTFQDAGGNTGADFLAVWDRGQLGDSLRFGGEFQKSLGPGITVSYFRTSTGNNITSAVRAGTYTATIAPRGAIVIRMRINVKLTSASIGAYGVSTRAVNGIMRDGVKAFVKTYP